MSLQSGSRQPLCSRDRDSRPASSGADSFDVASSLPKPDSKPLHPDVLSDSSSAPLHNYLDEFLAAIKVFGYLEKPVFHELSRHLQTRRLVAGDSLSLDADDKSFYCVVDGHVQVFAPSPPSATTGRSSTWGGTKGDGRTQQLFTEDEEKPLNGYDLLTEVSSGGTLSSLFTILSLFTEDIVLDWEQQPVTVPPPASSRSTSGSAFSTGTSSPSLNGFARHKPRANSDVSQIDLDQSSSAGTATPGFSPYDDVPPRSASSMGSRIPSAGSSQYRAGGERARFTGGGGADEERGSVARATGPSVLFWMFSLADHTNVRVPHQSTRLSPSFLLTRQYRVRPLPPRPLLIVCRLFSFRRLTRKFPKASAHIVQGQPLLEGLITRAVR